VSALLTESVLGNDLFLCKSTRKHITLFLHLYIGKTIVGEHK
jgi:hypothetical protein